MPIGNRLRQARIAAGMTQSDVVERLASEGVSLTKAGLSKYERGGSTPKASVLRALGTVLGVDATYFLKMPIAKVRWLAFRKAARMGKKRQERVKILAEQRVLRLLALRSALEPEQDYDVPGPMRVRTPEEAEAAAEALRQHWRLGDQPIESVTEAIEDGGGIVVESPVSDDLMDGLSGWANKRVPVIVVNAGVSDDRRRFSLAHELGHLFMVVEAASRAAVEKLAHRFAAAFLVTAESARRELGARRRRLNLHELMLLKQKHGLSMQGWILRAGDLGIIDQSHVGTLFAEMGAQGWRQQEPVHFQGEERPTKFWQLTLRALAEGLLTRREAERICPGVTIDLGETGQKGVGALDARALMRMSKEERDRLMEQAAAVVAEEYEDGGGLSGFESLSEEDHYDESIRD